MEGDEGILSPCRKSASKICYITDRPEMKYVRAKMYLGSHLAGERPKIILSPVLLFKYVSPK